MDVYAELVRIGAGRPNPESTFGDPALARVVLAEWMGEQAFKDLVHAYVRGDPTAELARSVLALVRPAAAMHACYAVFDGDGAIEGRRAAVELLRVVADAQALDWIDQFLDDPDPEIQRWGALVLDRLVYDELVEPEAAEPAISAGEMHENPRVREQMRWIREALYRRRTGR